jgi:hypothetical protein
VPPVQERVTGVELRRIGHLARDHDQAGEGTVALARSGLADGNAERGERRDLRRVHRADDDVAGSHPRDRIAAPPPDVEELPLLPVREEELDEPVDLPSGRIAEIAEPHQPG